jgi:glutathione S-transferase
MLALSPKGTVPVLDADGVVIDESLQIMRWALAQNDPDDWLLAGDSFAALWMEKLIEGNDQIFKTALNRYKYAERYPEQPMEAYRAEGGLFLQKLDELLEGREYLLADHQSLADIALLPFVRQFAHVDREWFAQTPYVRLQAWLQRFLESELFTSIMKKSSCISASHTPVARELAPARLRSSRGLFSASEILCLQDLGLLRNPAGASSLATMVRVAYASAWHMPSAMQSTSNGPRKSTATLTGGLPAISPSVLARSMLCAMLWLASMARANPPTEPWPNPSNEAPLVINARLAMTQSL